MKRLIFFILCLLPLVGIGADKTIADYGNVNPPGATDLFLLEKGDLSTYENFKYGDLLGQVTNAVNGAVASLTNIVASGGAGSIYEYWVSPYGGGTGVGTNIANPFDGSTQSKFDTVMENVITNHNGNAVIHLIEGTFTTAGQFGSVTSAWPLLSNVKLDGAGMGHTIIKLKNNPGTNAAIIATARSAAQPWITGGGRQTNVEICNLTLDINGDNWTPGTATHGIQLVGRGHRVHHVEVIHGVGSHAAGAEGFAIGIAGLDYNMPGVTPGVSAGDGILPNSGNVIENCYVHDVSTNCTYYNGFGIYECEGGRISGNIAVFPVSTNSYATHTFHGINIAGNIAVNVYGNAIFGGTEGLYSDGELTALLGLTNCLVHDNTFTFCDLGWNIAPYSNCPSWGMKLYNNSIIINRWGNELDPPALFEMRGFQMYAQNYDTEIYGNRILGPGAYGTNYFAGYLGAPSFQRSPGVIRIHDNVWENNSDGIGIESTVTNFFEIKDNHSPNGQLVTTTLQTNSQQYIKGTLLGQAAALVNSPLLTNAIAYDNSGKVAANFTDGVNTRNLFDRAEVPSFDWTLRSFYNSNTVDVLDLGNKPVFHTNVYFDTATATTLAAFDASKGLTSLANGSGYLKNNGAGTWSYDAGTGGAGGGIVTNSGSGQGNFFTNPIISGAALVGSNAFGNAQEAYIDASGNASFASMFATTLTASTLYPTNLAATNGTLFNLPTNSGSANQVLTLVDAQHTKWSTPAGGGDVVTTSDNALSGSNTFSGTTYFGGSVNLQGASNYVGSLSAASLTISLPITNQITTTQPILSQSTTTNGPSNTELATAGWVRGLFNQGTAYYNSQTVASAGTNNSSGEPLYTYQSTIPASSARSYATTGFLTNGGYLGSVVTTNTFQQLSGSIVVNAYLGFIGGSSTPTLSVHPEIYYSYDRTNWYGDYAAGPQNITYGSTNLYQWAVDFPLTTSTNSGGFYVQRRFKCDSVTGSGTRTLWALIGTNVLSGVNDAGHTTMPSPTANAGNAFLAANQTFTGNNTFTTGTRTFTHDSSHTLITNATTATATEWTGGTQKEYSSAGVTMTMDKTNGNLTAIGTATFQTYDQPTNTWAIDSLFGLGTNSYITVATGGSHGITGINNVPSSTARWGELTILVSSSDLTLTNLASIRTSDLASSRVVTNGNTAVISIEVLPGRCTNMAIVQFK